MIEHANEEKRIHSFKVIDNGIAIIDLIPVRFMNDQGQTEGAMFDRVSGKLFKN